MTGTGAPVVAGYRVRGRPLERLGAGAYVCRLGEGTAVFNLAGEASGLVDGLANEGGALLLAGLPTVDAARLEQMFEGWAGRDVKVALTGLLAAQTAGRAVVEAAREGRVGAPVYLRYAAEWPSTSEDEVWWHAAEAVLLAAEALGPAVEVYAARAGRGLSLMLKHAHGASSLLGIGVGSGEVPATLLLLGDEGAVEAVPPVFCGLGDAPGAVTDRAALLRRSPDTDVGAEMSGWLAAALPLLGDAAVRERGARLARWAVVAQGAVRESLASGRPVAIAEAG